MRVRMQLLRENEFGACVQFVRANKIGETEWI